jgi:hypothetical protein
MDAAGELYDTDRRARLPSRPEPPKTGFESER